MSSWQEMAEAGDEISMTSLAWSVAKDLIETQKVRLSLQEARIAELERREALLTEAVMAVKAIRSDPVGERLIDAWNRFYRADGALTDAGFPWPTGTGEEPDSVCPACGETFSTDCWRCVGAEDPRS